jgi:RNA polymerase sigma factor (sigma-70 family)
VPDTPAEVPRLIDLHFRQQAGKMVAVLSRILGFHNVDVAEEIVQDTLLSALQVWSFRGVPPNPGGWLMVSARNRAIDYIRRERSRLKAAEDLRQNLRSEWTLSATVDREFEEPRIQDDLLRMIFTCCDPRLDLEDQVALTLKFPCGFSTTEIAAALLCPEETVRKRLYRARQKLRDDREAFQMPAESQLEPRLDAVLQVVYLIFSEGYKSAEGETLIRAELCDEALRLAAVLSEQRSCARPKTFALLALLCFQAARLEARTYEDGSICQLEQQDRGSWNAGLISRGFGFLDRCAQGTELSRYHVEAAIASCHCGAESFERTDWSLIVTLYGKLLAIYDTPIVRLNRAIAVGYAQGASAALRELDEIRRTGKLERYYLLPASLGEFHLRDGNPEEARAWLQEAARMCPSPREREFLVKRIERCEEKAGGFQSGSPR